MAKDARKNKNHVLALVTGVPGAGKTLLGLKYVYSANESDAIYLSGNGPLIKVLERALNSKNFVRNVMNLVREYISSGAKDFNKNILVFDEGQRAWDSAQMSAKRHVNNTEPELLIRMMKERVEWCVLLVLIGEGQEINSGEYGGIKQWNDAIDDTWQVICPPKLDDIFTRGQVVDYPERDKLNLTISLRTHLFADVSNMMNSFIAGDFEVARQYRRKAMDFPLYVTRNLNSAKLYCRERYMGEPDKHYGLLASSKAMDLNRYGIRCGYNDTSNIDYGIWYNNRQGEVGSSCELNTVATEFACQGLELDMPIVCWGDDMLLKNAKWSFEKSKTSEQVAYRQNSYRVLLTRGRDGCVIFVPPEQRYNELYEMLSTMASNSIDYGGEKTNLKT